MRTSANQRRFYHQGKCSSSRNEKGKDAKKRWQKEKKRNETPKMNATEADQEFFKNLEQADTVVALDVMATLATSAQQRRGVVLASACLSLNVPFTLSAGESLVTNEKLRESAFAILVSAIQTSLAEPVLRVDDLVEQIEVLCGYGDARLDSTQSLVILWHAVVGGDWFGLVPMLLAGIESDRKSQTVLFATSSAPLGLAPSSVGPAQVEAPAGGATSSSGGGGNTATTKESTSGAATATLQGVVSLGTLAESLLEAAVSRGSFKTLVALLRSRVFCGAVSLEAATVAQQAMARAQFDYFRTNTLAERHTWLASPTKLAELTRLSAESYSVQLDKSATELELLLTNSSHEPPPRVVDRALEASFETDRRSLAASLSLCDRTMGQFVCQTDRADKQKAQFDGLSDGDRSMYVAATTAKSGLLVFEAAMLRRRAAFTAEMEAAAQPEVQKVVRVEELPYGW